MTKVLVVEDDGLSRHLVSEILTAHGFKVDKAADGLEAIRMTDNEFYDFILMDINLPGIDGIKTTRIIKNKPNYKDVPVIALTAIAMKGDKERILASGLDDYISKPIDLSDFIKLMGEYRIGGIKSNAANRLILAGLLN